MRQHAFLILLIASLFPSISWGNIQMEMVKAKTHPYKLAFQAISGNLSDFEKQRVQQAVRHDLILTGQFHINPQKNALTANNFLNLQKHSYPFWLEINSNILSLKEYSLQFQLYRLGSNKPLWKKDYNLHREYNPMEIHEISRDIALQISKKPSLLMDQFSFVRKPNPNLYQLMISDFSGENASILKESHDPLTSLRWSPNGQYLAYVSYAHKQPSLWLYDTENNQHRLLKNDPGLNNAPAWSKDGKTLAFTVIRDQHPHIDLLNIETGEQTPLTQGWSINTEPCFSLDDKQLWFTSNRGGSPQIYAWNLETKEVNRISYSGTYNSAPLAVTSNQLLITHKIHDYFSLALLEINQQKMRILTQMGFEHSAMVIPKYQSFMFATQYAKRQVIEMQTLDGEIIIRYIADHGDLLEPAWRVLI
jgi:TolB protein